MASFRNWARATAAAWRLAAGCAWIMGALTAPAALGQENDPAYGNHSSVAQSAWVPVRRPGPWEAIDFPSQSAVPSVAHEDAASSHGARDGGVGWLQGGPAALQSREVVAGQPSGLLEPLPAEQNNPDTLNLSTGETTRPAPARSWSIDYRVRGLCDSVTSFEFGTSELPPTGWAPLSQLNFSLDSYWHGLRFRLPRPQWEVHVEWLTPMQEELQGGFSDYDWVPPNPDGSFTDLGFSQQRWINGQMLEFDLEVQMLQDPFGIPSEIWPIVGFRWQRFGIMAYNLVQVKEDNVWPTSPYAYSGDVIDFRQDYYSLFAGLQFRTMLDWGPFPRTQLTLQGDVQHITARNVDHHLLRRGDRYTMETTSGSAAHVGFTAEVLVSQRLSLGLEVDHLQIRTTGTHRWLNVPLGIDETWDHGVRVWSDQTWLTAFVAYRI
ncbi:MAG: hypothetical protein ACYC0X_30915 [Pirellulaceae bacterium]